jgi:hypothetical protein
MPPARKATGPAATRAGATKPVEKSATKGAAKTPKQTPKQVPKKTATRSPATVDKETRSPSSLIDERIAALGDWRGDTLARVRTLIHDAVPGVVEDWKWRGVPTWEHAGIICTGETYKDYVKLTFPKGASLPDPKRLFNSSLEGNARRAIDIREGERIDAAAMKKLVRAAADLNAVKPAKGK